MWGCTCEGCLPGSRQALHFLCPATAGSIPGASTGAKVAYVFSRLEDYGWQRSSRLCHPAIEFGEIGLHPGDTGEFDLAVRRDPENRRHMGQAIGVRHGILVSVVEQYRERHTEFFC